MVLGLLGITPDRPPTAATFAGLPMPEKVWDDEAGIRNQGIRDQEARIKASAS